MLTKRIDEKCATPHAPPHVYYPASFGVPADEVMDPEVTIADYGTSFLVALGAPSKLNTPALSLPPEDFFDEPITQAVDIWTLGVTIYELLGHRPLLEVEPDADEDDILHGIFNILGTPPQRWWDKWAGRAKARPPSTTSNPTPLRQRLWEMRKGDSPASHRWDVGGGELQAFEDLLKGMIAFEPSERLTAQQLMRSEYMVEWALPAWERQQQRKEGR